MAQIAYFTWPSLLLSLQPVLSYAQDPEQFYCQLIVEERQLSVDEVIEAQKYNMDINKPSPLHSTESAPLQGVVCLLLLHVVVS